MTAAAPPAREAAIWHDVECGPYQADLAVWRRLAGDTPARVLELGCGTGRAALDLAAAGHVVTGVDREQELLDALAERAAARGAHVACARADILELDLDEEFDLVIAPMQLLQVVGDELERGLALAAMVRHLSDGGRAAAAIVEASASVGVEEAAPAVLPDVREIDGWVYSSLPLAVESGPLQIAARRLRHRVAPDGELDEHVHVDRLSQLDADALEREAEAEGLRAVERIAIDTDEAYVGATVCVWEAGR